MNDIYCPKCSETAKTKVLDVISPGLYDWLCPGCKTEFKIKIEFIEVENE